MTQPEYIAALLSIIVGLGLTDLAQSLRELVRPRRRVDWHWLPLLWAATTFLLAVQIWWNWMCARIFGPVDRLISAKTQ